MTIDEARQHLDAIAINPNADFAHQDFVDEARKLRKKKDDRAQARLEEALATVMLEGNDTEVMVAADALMAIPVRAGVLRHIVSTLPTLSMLRRDAAMRVLGVHRTQVPKPALADLSTLLLAHPHEYLRLALVVLADAVPPERDVLWQALVDLAAASSSVDELVLVVRAASAANRLGELLATLKNKPPSLVREVARLSQEEAAILGPLGIESSEAALDQEFAHCADPSTLVLLVKEAVAVGCVSRLPGWLKSKDGALLKRALLMSGPDESLWFQAALPRS